MAAKREPLLLTRHRAGSDQLPLTHEFLSMMLVVRRAGVTGRGTLQQAYRGDRASDLRRKVHAPTSSDRQNPRFGSVISHQSREVSTGPGCHPTDEVEAPSRLCQASPIPIARGGLPL
jgi:hypothetical protein